MRGVLPEEYEGALGEWDINEDSPFGGFVGLDWQLKEDAHGNVEFQYTGSAFARAAGLTWILQ